MGASTSVSLRPEEIDDLRQVSVKEIQRLWARFRKLDRGSKGAIRTSDFFKIPELAMNPLAHRISAALELGSNSGEVNFRGFVKALSVFHKKAPREKKLQFVFSVYDVDADGLISIDDLTTVLKSLVGNNLEDTEIADLANNTVEEFDVDGDDCLSLAEFRRCIDAGGAAQRASNDSADVFSQHVTIKF